jgi:hypothetical protein
MEMIRVDVHVHHLLSAGSSALLLQHYSGEGREPGVLACQNQATACFDKTVEAVHYTEKAEQMSRSGLAKQVGR